jgi:hypothetical protein
VDFFSHHHANSGIVPQSEECVKDLGGKARRKETALKPGCRWEDNIKMDLRKIQWGAVDLIHLAQNRDQWGSSCEHGNEPSGYIHFGKFSSI